MDASNPILPPSPNIIDGKDDYIYHDVDDEYSPRSLPKVIQAPSHDSKAVREEKMKAKAKAKAKMKMKTKRRANAKAKAKTNFE